MICRNMREKLYSLLRWSEHYTKADMAYLARGNFWVVSGQILTSVISFALLLIFANFLSKETYGLYKYVISLASIFNILTLTGMNQSVAQAVATGNEGALRRSVSYQLKWNLMMMVALFALGGYYVINNNSEIAITMFIIGLFAPFTAALNTYGAYLDGKKEFRLNNLWSVFSTLIYSIGMAITIFLSNGVIYMVLTYSLTTFAATLFFYFLTLKKFRPPVSQSVDVLKYGRELTFIGFIGPIVSQIDKIVLAHFWGATELAVYSLATAIPDRATSFIKDWLNVVFPKLAQRTPEEINQVFWIRIVQGLLVGALCAVAYIIIAPFFFKYFLPQYLDTVGYSQLLAISLLFAMPNRYISIILTVQKLSKLIFWNSLIQNIIRVLLYIVLGIWGGIFGLVIAYIANNLISLIINISIWKSKKVQGNPQSST